MTYLHQQLLAASCFVGLVLTMPQATALVSQPWGADHNNFANSGFGILMQGSRQADELDLDEALNTFEAASEKLPSSMMTLFSLGETHYELAQNTENEAERLHHLKEAEWNFDRVTNINPDFVLGFYKLSETLWEQDRYKDAIKSLDVAIGYHPEDVILHYSRALSLEKLERNKEAVDTYQHIITLQPRFAIAYHNLGDLFISMGDFKNAETVFKQGMSVNGLDGAQANGFRMSLAELYINQSRWEEAQQELVYVLKAEPDNFMAYLELGHLQFEQKHFNQALALYTKASELNPEYAETYYYLSLTLQALDRDDESLAEGMHYVSLAPDGEYARKTIERLASLKDKK